MVIKWPQEVKNAIKSWCYLKRNTYQKLGKISALCKSKSYLSPAHKPNKLGEKKSGEIGWDSQTHRWLTASLNGVAIFERASSECFPNTL